MSTTLTTRRGADWLLGDTAADAVFTIEQLSDEHRLIARTADDFMRHEVAPVLDRLEQKDWALARRLVERCGELGLLGTDVPEALGGVALDKVASIVVGEAVGRVASFATTFGAQSGLAITPLLCFGTEDQQRKYVTRLVTGELIGAYALSEAGSGSDALGAKARATRRSDGSFSLSGEKMWITNGGFADLFIVFAKVDGEQFTAFIVERAFAGVSTGKEEHKLGLHGSSTTPLILQDAQVPAGQVLGEVGKGHKVAFNVLNYGRLKLAAMCSGGARAVIGEAVRYATERRQFGRPIASFGAIRHKLAEMAVREYAVEAMLYRTAGLIDGTLGEGAARRCGARRTRGVRDRSLHSQGGRQRDARLRARREPADSWGQRLRAGLSGRASLSRRPREPDFRRYQRDQPPAHPGHADQARPQRDPALDLRRARSSGRAAVAGGRTDLPGDEVLGAERRTIVGMKKAALAVLGTAMQTFGESLTDQQEVLSSTADILIDVFAAESVVLRAGRVADPAHVAAARVFVSDAAARVEMAARSALGGTVEGDALRTVLAALRRFLKPVPVNTVRLRREIADAVVARAGYPF